ncbi:hypothetical protein BCV69DRAFT_280060 [Microstroma glucosiphilum]|uniref:Vacuolar protein sorting-associated protein 54 n=1 Tax=Pseudomicrostroma glucosiphilum TaxID=1684307 RepID=A0A316UJM2_9BASI|nr:hypothetical protein BCV69DRAFT_280060 [Pseudomicrostroma glucosiphilum]PWN24163.1 hypothetical protein BCV69DRAFT_280060 [Pseudomicrostroma glucosiphilum]
MAVPSINRPDSPGSDTESVVSSVAQTTSRLGLGGLASANYSSLNLSSLGLSANAVASSSSAASSSSLLNGFNGISTVLNNPRKKQHAIDPNSSRWAALPAHKDAEISRPPKQSVQSYVDEVSAEWERYTRNRDLGSRGKAKTSRDEDSESRADLPDRSQEGEGSKSKLPPISAVPQVFFDDDFNLGNPYTFDIVTERYGSANAKAGTSGEQSGPVIAGDHVEKLSHYSDLVEQHLLHEIATRSGSFFSALGALQDLAHSSTSCLSLIRTLRSDLISISDNQVKTGLRIVRKQDERRGIVKQMQAVERIKGWCEGKRMAELMVGQGEYDEALLVIESLQRELAPKDGRFKIPRQEAQGTEEDEEQASMVSSFVQHDDQDMDSEDLDLSKVPAILALAPELEDLKASITTSLEAELSSVLHADLDPRSGSAMNDTASSVRTRIQPLLESLTRTQGLEKALTSSYRPLALASIRVALEVSLPSPTEDSVLTALFDLLDDDVAATGRGESRSGEAGAIAARRLREMGPEEFDPLLRKVCQGLEDGVHRVERQERGILEILDSIARQSKAALSETNGTDVDEIDYVMPIGVPFALPALFNSQLQASVEVAHILVARLISLRASTHAQMDLAQFLGVFTPLTEFAERTERVSLVKERESSVASRKLVPLRSTLLNQAKEWLRYFHRIRLEQAARWVEEEIWAQVDVSVDSVKVLKTLVAAATEDPVEWIGETAEKADEVADTDQSETAPSAKTLVFPSETSNGTLDGDEKSYYMVPATLRVLALTQEYMQTVVNFEKVGTTEIMSRVVEFLKQFNSRTCQVVLGAGAMRSAGLKNITAKHLALASQSLSLFIHLIPYLRECVRRHLPDERQAIMLVEFDKLKRDFREHQYEIHAKLVAIMGDRLSVHCRGLSATNWNAPISPADAEGVAPSKPVSDLIKETTTLHKVLSKYLQESVVESVFTQVLDAIVKRVGAEFAKVEVTRDGGDACQRRMKEDVEQLDQRLGSLRGAKWDADSLRAIVASKVPMNAPAAPTPAPAESPATPAKAGSVPMTQTVTGDGTGTPRSGPAPYRSKFSFARKGAGTPQQSMHQLPGSPGPGSPLGTPRMGIQALPRGDLDTSGSQRGSIDVVSLPPPVPEVLGGHLAQQGSGVEVEGQTAQETNGETAQVVAEPVAPTQAAQASAASAEHETKVTSDGPAIGENLETARSRVSQDTLPAHEPPVSEATGNAQATEQLAASEASKAEGASQTSTAEPAALPSPSLPPAGGAGGVAAEVPTQVAAAPTENATVASALPSSPVPPLPSPAPSPSLTPTTSGVSTPTRGPRMTLQQRLAEAARKRAAAAPSATSAAAQPTVVATPVAEASAPPEGPAIADSAAGKTEVSAATSISAKASQDKEVPPPPTPPKDSRTATLEERSPVKPSTATTEPSAAPVVASEPPATADPAETTSENEAAGQQQAQVPASAPASEAAVKEEVAPPSDGPVGEASTTSAEQPEEAEKSNDAAAAGVGLGLGIDLGSNDAAKAEVAATSVTQSATGADVGPKVEVAAEAEAGAEGDGDGDGDGGADDADAGEEEEGAGEAEDTKNATAAPDGNAPASATSGPGGGGGGGGGKKKKKKNKKKGGK